MIPSIYEIVIPTVGRPSLADLLDSLARSGVAPTRLLVVDDRPTRSSGPPLDVRFPDVRLLASGGRGPAAARNVGWRVAQAEWVAFLDDDVVVDPEWAALLEDDLAGAGPLVGGVQGSLDVPVPSDRRPTDWERNVGALATAQWATADMAYRRVALASVGGFDERFPAAYREDADLALRVMAEGWQLHRGRRVARHPVRPAPLSISVRLQRGNADDALMRRLHGRRWREAAGAGPGRFRRHLAVTSLGLAAAAAALSGRRRPAMVLAAGWLAGTAELALARIAPGPRKVREVLAMATTSVLIPPAAVRHRVAGEWRHRRAAPIPPAAVLFDRDGTLVHDVPYNGDPRLVAPMPEAAEAVARLRRAGISVGVVSNQSGVGRGLITEAQVDAVNRRVDALVGPFDAWAVCHHAIEDGCRCRKPGPGLVLQAAATLGVHPARCAVIGDIGADMDAARAAGARGVLVPTPFTRPEEVAAAPEVAATVGLAVDRLLGIRARGAR